MTNRDSATKLLTALLGDGMFSEEAVDLVTAELDAVVVECAEIADKDRGKYFIAESISLCIRNRFGLSAKERA